MKKNFLDRVFGASVDATGDDGVKELQTEVELQAEEIKKLTEANAALTSQLAELAAYAEAAEKAKEKLAAEAAEAKALARKEKIVAAVGTDKADALLVATKDMDDAGFSAVIAALGVKEELEKASTLFNEVGASVEVNASKVRQESPEMKLINEKYKR